MPTPSDPEDTAGAARANSGTPADPVAPAPSTAPTPVPPPDREPGTGHDTANELLQLVLSTSSVEAYLAELVRFAQRVSLVIAGVGITVRRAQGVLSVAVSNPYAGAVDEVQYQLDQGPCLQALNTGQVVTVDDVGLERRFGGWPTHVLTHGVLSSLSVPLRVAGTTVGALNSYSRRAHTFHGAVRDELIALAAQAEVSLALTIRAAEQTSVLDQLHTAMQTRSTIDQALGMVMSRERCTAAEAFTVLRSASQSRNRPVVEIAAELILTTTGNPPQAGRFET